MSQVSQFSTLIGKLESVSLELMMPMAMISSISVENTLLAKFLAIGEVALAR